MLVSGIWACVVLIVVVIVNSRYGEWQKRQEPMADKQYNEFKKQLNDLQNQISKLSMYKGFSDE